MTLLRVAVDRRDLGKLKSAWGFGYALASTRRTSDPSREFPPFGLCPWLVCWPSVLSARVATLDGSLVRRERHTPTTLVGASGRCLEESNSREASRKPRRTREGPGRTIRRPGALRALRSSLDVFPNAWGYFASPGSFPNGITASSAVRSCGNSRPVYSTVAGSCVRGSGNPSGLAGWT